MRGQDGERSLHESNGEYNTEGNFIAPGRTEPHNHSYWESKYDKVGDHVGGVDVV